MVSSREELQQDHVQTKDNVKKGAWVLAKCGDSKEWQLVKFYHAYTSIGRKLYRCIIPGSRAIITFTEIVPFDGTLPPGLEE